MSVDHSVCVRDVFVYLLKLLFVCLLFLLVRMPHIRAYERFNGKPLVEYVRITKQIVNKSWRFHVTVLCLSLKTNWQRKSAVSTIESDFICFGFGMRFDQWYTYIKPYQEFSNWFFFQWCCLVKNLSYYSSKLSSGSQCNCHQRTYQTHTHARKNTHTYTDATNIYIKGEEEK